MGQGLALKGSLRFIALLAVLASCGNEKSEPSPVGTAVVGMARNTLARVSGKRAAVSQPASTAQTPRAELEKYDIPILRVIITSRDADLLVTISDTKGQVVTWTTTDATAFTLRDGILIQTRGLGPDLMSAAAPSVSELRIDGGTHLRSYFFLGEDDRSTRRDYACTVSIIGDELIEIFARQHKTVHVKEDCLRPEGRITNEFWIEAAMVRKSRQWASPGAGYLDFEMAVD